MMPFGTTPQGEAIQAFSLCSPELKVRLTNYGARLLEVVYAGKDLLYGPKTADELLHDTCYCGSICGRVANRIAGASFTLGGRTYPLAANNGANHLHGGNCGFSDRLWQVGEASATRVALRLHSPDGEEGYPGQVDIRATYLLEGRKLSLTMEAETDAPTLLNLTNHAYWNLNAAGTVDQHRLLVHASAYTPMVANIPTGDILRVEGSLYDLNEPALLGERHAPGALEGGYDDNYVLPAAPGIREAAVLTNGSLSLHVSTDAPGLQVYTGDYLPLPRGGIALEAQSYPDSPHHPHFPSIVLLPGEPYRRTIIWELEG